MRDTLDKGGIVKKRYGDKMRKRAKRRRAQVDRNWEDNGYFKLDAETRISHETGETLHQVVDELGLACEGEAIDLIVGEYCSAYGYLKKLEEKSASGVVNDKRASCHELQLLHEETNSRLLAEDKDLK